MTALSSITAAASDTDLLDRLTAAAAQANIPDQRTWVTQRALQIASTPITDTGDTIASVYEYALATYTPTPRPGQDPSKVTDDQLRAAIAAVKATT